jgi:hypothetical protein
MSGAKWVEYRKPKIALAYERGRRAAAVAQYHNVAIDLPPENPFDLPVEVLRSTRQDERLLKEPT